MRGRPTNPNHGVCGKTENIGYTTMYNDGNEISNERFVTTMAHEIGHNWGAEHDPPGDTTCTPNSVAGGHFLLFWVANYGNEPNNHLFSPCSRKDIGEVLRSRGDPGCFMLSSQVKTCGDGIVQGSEQCDEAGLLFKSHGGCCTADCKLNTTASCSTSSSPCCTASCQTAPDTQDCFPTDRVIQPCELIPKCNGEDFDVCPRAQNRPDGSVCNTGVGASSGHCSNGQCVTVCHQLGVKHGRQLETCHCTDNHHDMCVFCCRDTLTGDCEATTEKFPENAPCFIGTCHHDICYTSYYTAHHGFRKPLSTTLQLVIALSMAISLILITVREVKRNFTLFAFSVYLINLSSWMRKLKGYKK